MLWTQRELAERAGVALRTVYAAEKGKDLRQDSKRKILKALGVPFTNHRDVFTNGGVTAPAPEEEVVNG